MSLYGKHFASMYSGSMIGKGAMAFALMGYVISNMQCRWRGVGREKIVIEATVRLHPTLLSATLGEAESDVQKGIDFLCSPDPISNTKGHAGRRLIKISEFDYEVVNAPYYQNLKDVEDRREKDRARQARCRSSKKNPHRDYAVIHEAHLAKSEDAKIEGDAV